MGIIEPLDLLAQRRVTNDLRWASRTWNGSPYFVRGQAKSPKEIVAAVMESSVVRKAIKEVASKANTEEENVTKEAQDILAELAHDFHMYAIRWFGLGLSTLGKRLYNSIQVNTEKLEQIKEAYASYPVLLLPTHRSYVDFLLVSYMNFSFELALPIIAAGMDFKGMVGVGEFLRKSGAFFIRRRFGGDKLYWAIISEYVKKAILEGGHPFEMFVEGTRSRSGKSIKPKVGLLKIVTELVTSGQIPDILILPISMSYDRTLEERLYAHELLGKPKPKESTNGLLKALKWLGNQNYGSVYVNFGDLISIRQMIEKSVTFPRPEVPMKSVEDIALKVVLDQQAHLVVPLFAGISLVILSKVSTGSITMPLKKLVQNIEFLQRILALRNSRFGFPLLGESLEANVVHIIGVHSSLVSIQRGSSKDAVLLINCRPGDSVQHMVFQHYSNQILNFILPFSIIVSLQQTTGLFPFPSTTHSMVEGDEEGKEAKYAQSFEDDYVFVRELLQEDFLYENTNGWLAEEFQWALKVFQSLSSVQPQQPQHQQSFKVAAAAATANVDNNNDAVSEFNLLLSDAIQPYLFAYWGVCIKLLEISHTNPTTHGQNPFELKELGKICQNFLVEYMKSGMVKPYGALSLETLTNAIYSLVKVLALERIKIEDGSFGILIRDPSLLSTISSRLQRVMGVDLRISNTKSHSSNSPSSTSGIGSPGGHEAATAPIPKLLSKL